MEQALQMTALCVVGALLTIIIKRGAPEQALLLTLGMVALGLLFLSSPIQAVLTFLKDLEKLGSISHSLLLPLYKTIGISLVIKVGGELCKDAGESALASVLETTGVICALVTAIPLLNTVLALLLELMR